MSATNVLHNPDVDELTWTRAPAPSGHWLQIMLLVTTLLTTTAVGARYMYNFELGNAPLTSFTDLFPFAWIRENPDRIGGGLPFHSTVPRSSSAAIVIWLQILCARGDRA
jgi:hypothetical protein